MFDSSLKNGASKQKALRACLAFGLGAAMLHGTAGAQEGVPYAGVTEPHAAVQPSNEQLVSPAIERKIDALLKQMTLEEKLGQLVQYGDSGEAAVAELGGAAQQPGKNPETHVKIDVMNLAATGRLGSMLNVVGAERTNSYQHAAVEKSRLHIPLIFGADILHGYRTVYPIPLGLAATFDPELVTAVSHISAAEATTAGVRWFYSPMVDISRDPRWGRTQEGAGEDAYLGAAMARAYIRGYQGNDLSQPDTVAASVKHFAAYGAAEAGREYNTTDMSLSRLRQVYLPPYKAAVEAGAATMMSAFNALNGVPATANSFLLKDVLRNEWGFDGFVVSDYTAVMELRNHGIAQDAATAARKAFLAGVDVDMMSHYYDAELPAQIRSGRVPMAAVNEAVRRVLRVKFALGVFEHPYAQGTEVTAAVAEHRPLVRKAAEESLVLLQNKAFNGASPVLPLSGTAAKIALIGPLADDTAEMIGAWGITKRDPDVVTVRDALEARAKQTGGAVLYAEGTKISGDSEDGFAAAVDAAKQADVVVIALGESCEMSGEAGSRARLDLPGNQEKLLEEVAATGRPIVLLVFSGRPLVLDWAANHVQAIVESWFPGTEAGNAIANVLYGDVAPSGKLPMSFPRAVGQEPLYYNQFPTGRPPFDTDLTKTPTFATRFVSRYIDAPNDALFPFGYGLSYTEFAFSDMNLSAAKVPLHEAQQENGHKLITAAATVKNTGNRAATEVVQCYVRNLGASLEQPVRSLQGFTRVTLQPGESKKVSFELGFAELSFFDNAGRSVIEPTHYTVWIGGSSLATEHADFDVTP
ncbi:MAG TPA: glycoside hydrolase family 3 N-terminal domain-containing protein [Terracidiphilus sp.]|jgi:beta-glucosidase|nr:glycoside hydrolase family 3 N-terminal domain-containing protein [Terracidiphilus sp.]